MTARRAAALTAAILFATMCFLLFHGPTFTTDGYGDPAVRIECDSIITVGWPTDGTYLQDEKYIDHYSFHIVGHMELSDSRLIGLMLDCGERRDTYGGFLILLTVPTCVLASVALLAGRRPALDGPTLSG